MTDTQAINAIVGVTFNDDVFSKELCAAAERVLEIIDELKSEVEELQDELARYEE